VPSSNSIVLPAFASLSASSLPLTLMWDLTLYSVMVDV
jgi:hypothetical protein